jgi:hypothetical protein
MSYQGQAGGLYGAGSNQPPQALFDEASAAAASIQPRNRSGKLSPGGRIGVIAIGQSTTKQWFPFLQALARPLKPRVFFVNAGQDGMVAQTWASQGQPWSTAFKAVASSGLSLAQVQVLIVDSARIDSWKDGSLASQIRAYRNDLARIVARARSSFPNLKLVYIMPCHYAGYAGPGKAVREPFGYQEEFGIRQFILGQGAYSPVAVWGPYVFADTMVPYYYYDGVHFTTLGREKMASLTWDFFKSDPAINGWLWKR